jgi:hypothetical protein
LPALQVVHFLMGGQSLVQSVALTEHVGWGVHIVGSGELGGGGLGGEGEAPGGGGLCWAGLGGGTGSTCRACSHAPGAWPQGAGARLQAQLVMHACLPEFHLASELLPGAARAEVTACASALPAHLDLAVGD